VSKGGKCELVYQRYSGADPAVVSDANALDVCGLFAEVVNRF
jgi:hypothetical protein